MLIPSTPSNKRSFITLGKACVGLQRGREETEADYVNLKVRLRESSRKTASFNFVHCYRFFSRFASDHNSFGTPHLIYYLVNRGS